MAETQSSYSPKALFSLQGRIALVTGGGSGIGLMIARGLAAAGAKTYITGRRLNVLEKSAAELNLLEQGGKVIPCVFEIYLSLRRY
jgi:NAD(P)-dependent dehydrogenase (short-subunit alcohol dehydrogenase family)